MISDPSAGDLVFVVYITGTVKSVVITKPKPIPGLSLVAGKYSDQDREVHISSDRCYATEGEALEYAIGLLMPNPSKR